MDSARRLLDMISRCLSRYESLVAERPVLVAISGGIDSTVLALLMAKLQAEGRLTGPLHFAHVDHSVRTDSRQNAEHVVAFAERLGVPIFLRRLLVAGEHQSENALRNARYAALSEMARECGAKMLLTGHHADDNLETVLFRMLRGTGTRGLAGIPEARWHVSEQQRLLLVRPLLRARRITLTALLTEFGEQPYEDSTNTDLRYARNRLRLVTIPQLRKDLGLGLDVALMTITSTAHGLREILEAQGSRILAERTERRLTWGLRFDLTGLDEVAHPFIEEALRMAYSQLHQGGEEPLKAWTERALGLLCKQPGTRLAGRTGLILERTRNGLLLFDPCRAGAPPTGLGQEFTCDTGRQRFGATEWCVDAAAHPSPPLIPSPVAAGPYRALLDPAKTRLPWRLRTRSTGDRFRPLGYNAPIELRRYLQSRHVPRFDRDRLPLLVDANDTVLWVPGVQISELAKLELNTRQTVEVRVILA
jgi:tRNA(Ile)-lysidine synthase